MTKRISVLFAGALAAITGVAAPVDTANASTIYSYDISYDFPILRRNGTGSSSSPTQIRAGVGSVSGTITLDETYNTTFQLLSYNLTSVNTATAFTATNLMTYNSTDSSDTYSRVAPTTFSTAARHTFTTPDGSVACSAGLIAPIGIQNGGRRYQVGGSTLSLFIDRNLSVVI